MRNRWAAELKKKGARAQRVAGLFTAVVAIETRLPSAVGHIGIPPHTSGYGDWMPRFAAIVVRKTLEILEMPEPGLLRLLLPARDIQQLLWNFAASAASARVCYYRARISLPCP